ncbi:hypothetical protein CX676_14090 [Paracoccus zhejiangensis]|uniref:Uncharacterized protein n=1 Tax=Paracoccus zhejiangensis TaxID=1077935 RepID=A0A2H5F0U2_9RHOB|nr:hypothetical protein CX676_14090 [Paracoccus zhejiangensis]
MTPSDHPDNHELDDWPLYGPKDPEIYWLVGQLAQKHGMRLHEIEAIMLAALRRKMAELDDSYPPG